MGRLFWKFFLCILLAQLAATIGIGGAFWLRDRARSQAIEIDTGPPAYIALDAAGATLKHGGVAALRGFEATPAGDIRALGAIAYEMVVGRPPAGVDPRTIVRGLPDEVADAVAFLVSEHAGYITGEVLTIDGGAWLGRSPFQFLRAKAD